MFFDQGGGEICVVEWCDQYIVMYVFWNIGRIWYGEWKVYQVFWCKVYQCFVGYIMIFVFEFEDFVVVGKGVCQVYGVYVGFVVG